MMEPPGSATERSLRDGKEFLSYEQAKMSAFEAKAPSLLESSSKFKKDTAE